VPALIPCPVQISYAALAATGSAHVDGEYAVYLNSTDKRAYQVTFHVASESSDKPVSVGPVSTLGSTSPTGDDRAILIVARHPDVETLALRSVTDAEGHVIPSCAASSPYAVKPTQLADEYTFDDTAPWVKQDTAAAIIFVPPASTTFSSMPDLAAVARRRGLEGTTRVVLAIDEHGDVQDAEVLQSSGNIEVDDLAKAAAIRERFTPARLAADGGSAIPMVEDATVTISPESVLVTLR
jgi:TonB family protein